MSEAEQRVTLPAATERHSGDCADLATIQPGGLGYFCVQPNARVRVDAIRVYGPKDGRVSVLLVHLPSGEPFVAPPEERRSAALVAVNTSKLLDDAMRTVETSGMIGLTVQNDGREPVKLTVVAEGNFSMGDDGPIPTKWWGLCALLPRGNPSKAGVLTVSAQSGAQTLVHPPYDTPIVGVRMKTSAPQGTVRVTCVQVANVNLLIGGDVPIEAFAYPDGAPLRSSVVDPACRFSISLVSSHDEPVEVEAEYLILPRGVAKPEPTRQEASESHWDEVRAMAHTHGADVKIIETAARMMSPDQAGLFAEACSVETRQALVHHLVHKAGKAGS